MAVIKEAKREKSKPKELPFSVVNKLFENRKRTVFIIVVLVVVGFFGYKQFFAKSQKITYQTVQAEKGTLVTTVTASGQVLTANIVSISTTATGVVGEVFVKEGDKVTVGQKIMEVTLDRAGQAKNTQAYSNYLSAKTNLDLVGANAYSLRSTKDTTWNKFYNLSINSNYQNSDGSPRTDQRNSSAEFQSVQADWLAAEAKYKNQEAVITQSHVAVSSAWLSYSQSSPIITAPIAGTLSNLTFVAGMDLTDQSTSVNTNVSQRVAVIKNDQTPIVSVNLSEVDVPKIKIGENVTLTADSVTDKTFTGKVITLDKIGSVSSNVTNYPAIIKLDSGDDQLLPNMAVTAKIITSVKDDVLLVPSTAVQNSAGQSTIRIMQNGQPQSVSVEVGETSDTQTEISSGINVGETVVTGQTNPVGTSTQGTTTSPFSIGGNRGFGGLGGGAARGR